MSDTNSIRDDIQSLDYTNSIYSDYTLNSHVSGGDNYCDADLKINNPIDLNVILQPLPSYSNSFSFVSWNCDGFNFTDNVNKYIKQHLFDICFKDLLCDIYTFQEFRTHYFGHRPIADESLPFIPPAFDGYFVLNDVFLKNVIYIKDKWFPYTEHITTPQRDTTIYDFEEHHWCQWCIIHKHSTNLLPVSILIASFWRSPSRTSTLSAVYQIILDLIYIQKRFSNEAFQIIITGDFNVHHPAISLPTQTVFKSIDYIEYEQIARLLIDYKLTIINDQHQGTYHWVDKKTGNIKWSLLDLQIVSDKLLKNGYHQQIIQYIYGRKGHLPLLCILPLSDVVPVAASNINSPYLRSYRWKFDNPKDIEAYKAAAIALFTDIKQEYEPIVDQAHIDKNEIIDHLTYKINTELHELAVKHIGLYNSKKNKYRKPWCTKKVIKISKKTNKIFKQWLHHKTDRLHRKWKYWVKIRRKVCYQAKKQYAADLAFKCNLHGGDWWKIIKRINQFEKGYNHSSCNNNIPFLYNIGYDSESDASDWDHLDQCIYNDYIKANVFNHKYCYKSFDDNNPTESHIDLEKIPHIASCKYPSNNLLKAERIKNTRLRLPSAYCTKNALNKLNADIVAEEVLFAFFTINKTASYGLGIHIKLLSLIIHSIIAVVVWLLNLCFTWSHYGKIWKLSYIKPVLKPKRDCHQFANYRAITITGIWRKIIEKIISYRLLIYIIDLQLIDDYYLAALRGKSTIAAAIILLHNIHERWNRNIPTYAVFFDIAGCSQSKFS